MARGQQESLTLPVAQNKARRFTLRSLCLLGTTLSIFLLSACAAPLAFLSSTGTAAASSAGSAAVANPATAASLASTVTTGKSPLEHAASAATKKDCSFFNVLGAQPICVDVVLPTVTDKSEPFLGPADMTNSNSGTSKQ